MLVTTSSQPITIADPGMASQSAALSNHNTEHMKMSQQERRRKLFQRRVFVVRQFGSISVMASRTKNKPQSSVKCVGNQCKRSLITQPTFFFFYHLSRSQPQEYELCRPRRGSPPRNLREFRENIYIYIQFWAVSHVVLTIVRKMLRGQQLQSNNSG